MNRANTPYDSEHTPKAVCDCCGKYAELSFSVSYGIDTWACQECYWPAAHYDENFKPRKESK
jgi:hypothetical protein